jgi:hypothetical protein
MNSPTSKPHVMPISNEQGLPSPLSAGVSQDGYPPSQSVSRAFLIRRQIESLANNAEPNKVVEHESLTTTVKYSTDFGSRVDILHVAASLYAEARNGASISLKKELGAFEDAASNSQKIITTLQQDIQNLHLENDQKKKELEKLQEKLLTIGDATSPTSQDAAVELREENSRLKATLQTLGDQLKQVIKESLGE